LTGYDADDTLERVRQAADIVDVVGSYIPLKRAGHAFRALCPFHREKTPSFHVNPERQIFKCFGCGIGGDVFSFVQNFEKVDFAEALQILADRYNIALRKARSKQAAGPSKNDIFRVNRWAAGVYRKHLCSDAGRSARDYLGKRAISDETAKAYGLGLAPESWDFLLGKAREKSIASELLVAGGLVVPRPGADGFYDRFRNRLMFPIVDPRGNVVAFGGRSLGDDPAKYINSPETRAFSKSKTLYGLHVAKAVVSESGCIAVVEGYTDVLAAHQAGLKNVVATLGTAMTSEHLGVLSRYTDRVVLVFDGDQAGRHAAERAVDAFLGASADVAVALLEGELDPCDLIVQGGAEAFKRTLGTAMSALDFKIQAVSERHSTSTAGGMARAVDEIVETLTTVADPIRRRLFVREVAQRLRLVETDIDAALKKRRRRAGAGTDRDEPAGRPEAHTQAIKDVLRAALLSAELAEKVAGSGVDAKEFDAPASKAVLEAALDARGDVRAAMGRLRSEEAKSLAAELAADGEADRHLEARLDDALAFLRRRKAERETREATLRVREAANEQSEREALAELQQRLARSKRPDSNTS